MAVSTSERASAEREGEVGFIDLFPIVLEEAGNVGNGLVFVGGLEGGLGVGVWKSVCTTMARTTTAVLKAKSGIASPRIVCEGSCGERFSALALSSKPVAHQSEKRERR